MSFLLLSANSVVGKWKTIDDETGNGKSIVEIFEQENKLYGKVLKVFPQPGKSSDPVCRKCPGEKKGQKIVGMNIINGLEKAEEEWEADDGILDPGNGKVYDCKLWLESKDKLAVRGYIGFLYRTQYWFRTEE